MAQWLQRSNPWVTIALAASLAFNVGFLAAGLVGRGQPRLEPLPAEVDGRPLHEVLAMTPAQLARMQTERQALAARLAPLEESQDLLQSELGRLIDADQPDQAAIGAKLDELNELQRRTQDEVIAHHMQLRTFLSSEQCRTFARLIEPPEPRGRRRQGGRGLGRGGGGGAGGRGPGPHRGPPGAEEPGFQGAPGVPGADL